MKGHIQTTAPYKVSIQNVYDKVKPMNAEITLDPSDVSIDANINYDIGKFLTLVIIVKSSW